MCLTRPNRDQTDKIKTHYVLTKLEALIGDVVSIETALQYLLACPKKILWKCIAKLLTKVHHRDHIHCHGNCSDGRLPETTFGGHSQKHFFLQPRSALDTCLATMHLP